MIFHEIHAHPPHPGVEQIRRELFQHGIGDPGFLHAKHDLGSVSELVHHAGKRGQIILKVGVDADGCITLSGHVLQAREQGILMAHVASDPHAADATRECAGGFRNLLPCVVA